MKILVTGGAGFVGSHIVEALLEEGHDVTVMDNLSTGSIDNLPMDKIKFVHEDVATDRFLSEAFRGIDIIIHQAARGSVPLSIEMPSLTFRDNVIGFHNILQNAVDFGIKRVIYASSSSVHGDEKGNIISPYALSKKTNEQYAEVFERVYGLETVGLRYFNVFGPRQRLDSQYGAVVPIFIDAIKNGKLVHINGDGNQKRDFTYISNVVKANLLAIETKYTHRVYDIGCGSSTSVNELFDILNFWGGGCAVAVHGLSRKGDIRNSKADISDAEELMKYSPVINVKRGLELTYSKYNLEKQMV